MTRELADKTGPQVQSETPTKGERTRQRLLDLAYDSLVRKGFAATSIEELVEAAGITKSGFFYHFKDKRDLARQLIEREVDGDAVFLDGMIRRARELSDDPLHSFLIFLKLYAEGMEQMAMQHPGCFIATVTFQDLAYDREMRGMNSARVLAWRARFISWLEEIAEAHPPRSSLQAADLADAILAFTYGGLTLAKALEDTHTISRQALLFRETVQLHFQPC
jgi:AcrR family transcriptional regulator